MLCSPRATIRIECADLFDSVCRVLDEVRRSGMQLHAICATSGSGEAVELVVSAVEWNLFIVLGNRVRKMKNVSAVSVLSEQGVDLEVDHAWSISYCNTDNHLE